jgi:endothelin-converting enzyme
MASQPSTEQDQGDPERQPLLADRRDPEDAPRSESRAKKTLAWFARHAVLIFISLLFIAVALILVGFVKRQSSPSPRCRPLLIDTIESQAIQPVTETCQTPSCIHASSEILYNLDPNYKDIDPCTDFRQLTCGGWDERHDLRPDQGDAFTGTIMAEESQMLLRHILEAPYPDESKVGAQNLLELTLTPCTAFLLLACATCRTLIVC